MNGIDLLSISIIAIGLAIDCFAVSISGSIAMRKASPLQIIRVAFSFGVFQAGMTALGWLGGQTVAEMVESYDHWIAFGLLAIVGVHMIWESFRSDANKREHDISRGLVLIVLSIATSIDALAVGFSFSFLDVDIVMACSVIGGTSLVLSAIGMLLGKKLGEVVGKRAEVFGGIVLIGIGIRILVEHLL